MKKRIITVAFAATAMCSALALTSCGNESNYEDFELVGLDQLKEEKTTVTFWHSFGDNISTYLDELVENFETEMNEQGYKIDINLVNKGGGYDGLRSAVNLGTSSNAIPTMILGYPDHFADYIKNDILLPLDDFINAEDQAIALDTSDFVESYMSENNMIIKGENKVAGIPFNKSTEIMVYNSNVVDPILAKLGIISDNKDANGLYTDKWVQPTWDQVFAVSKYIKEHINDNSLNYIYKDAQYEVDTSTTYPTIYDSESNLFLTLSRQYGGDGKYTVLDENGNGTVVCYNDSNKEIMNQLIDNALTKKYIQIPNKESQNYGSNLLQALKGFISIGSTAGINNNASKKYNLKATGIPQLSYEKDDHQAVIQQGTNLAILSGNSNNKQRLAAWMLIKYLTNAENTEYFSESTGYLPVRESVLTSEKFTSMLANENDPFTGNVARAINAAFSQKEYFYTDAAFSGSSIVRDKVGVAVEDMLIYDKTFDQAMKNLYSELELINIKTKKL